nr:methyltransferase [Shewanella sp. NIFS-20-20]
MLPCQARALTRQLRLLSEARSLWQLATFEQVDLPWRVSFPQLAALVEGLSLSQIAELDSCQTRLVSALWPALAQDLQSQGLTWQAHEFMWQLAEPPWLTEQENGQSSQLESPAAAMAPEWLGYFSAHIKGRKWAQISGFVDALPLTTSQRVLEWCAGKGHLGRLLAKQYGVAVTSLEWQTELCQQGQQFAAQWHLPQTFICGDAFNCDTSVFQQQDQAVALHACGDLHVTLIKHSAAARLPNLAIAPCCYHLIQTETYQGLSNTWRQKAQEHQLHLSKRDLQLALAQSSVASPRAQQLGAQEMTWRLGFDSLQRHLRGQNHYLPVPALKRSQLSASFAEFCGWAAQQKGVELPNNIDLNSWLAVGEARLLLVRRLDLVAHLFRQLLEHALINDRISFLQSCGYSVKLHGFCDVSVTPRNALILASLPPETLLGE